MDLEKLPDSIRLKLNHKDEQQLWEKAEQKGLKTAAEETGFKPYNVYSWRSEKTFIPKKFVQNFMDNPEVESIKGGGRSKPSKKFRATEISDELLTRVNESVSINGDGVPVYQQTDRGCVKRFIELMEKLGEVPYSVYERDVFEVRYPKYIQQIFEKTDFDENLSAKIDETGQISDGKIILDGKRISVQDFSGKLYSREKRLQLAIERKDSNEMEKLMAAEAARIREAFE